MKKQSIKERIKALNAKQKRKFKTALIMSLVCVVLLSGATFAWFTISNTAKVNNLKLTVVAEGSLKIAEEVDGHLGTYSSEINFGTSGQKLYPCTTTTDGQTMKKPLYSSSDVVSGVKEIAEAEKNLYYYEKVMWLKVEETGGGTNQYAITLAKRSGETAPYTGSYVIDKSENNKSAANCIRISFIIDGTTVAIYEPNNGVSNSNEGSKATDNSGAGCTNTTLLHKQISDGTFIPITGKDPYYTNDSSELFSVTANTEKKVTVRVWFEGTDDQCTNAIQDGSIEGALTFVSHKK